VSEVGVRGGDVKGEERETRWAGLQRLAGAMQRMKRWAEQKGTGWCLELAGVWGGHLAPVDVNATKAFISCAGLNVLTKTRSFQFVSRACWYNFSCMVANCRDDVAKLSHRCVSMILLLPQHGGHIDFSKPLFR
jgi:hypothetical protein